MPAIYLCAQCLSWKSLKAISELWERHKVDAKCSIHCHVNANKWFFFYLSVLCTYFNWTCLSCLIKFAYLLHLTKGNECWLCEMECSAIFWNIFFRSFATAYAETLCDVALFYLWFSKCTCHKFINLSDFSRFWQFESFA